jgi:hypothetical protein
MYPNYHHQYYQPQYHQPQYQGQVYDYSQLPPQQPIQQPVQQPIQQPVQQKPVPHYPKVSKFSSTPTDVFSQLGFRTANTNPKSKDKSKAKPKQGIDPMSFFK